MEANQMNESKPKKKKGSKLWPIVGVLTAGALIVWVFSSNLFGIREKSVDLLRKIPIVNNIVKSPSETNLYASMTREELIAKVESLNSQLTQSQTDLAEAQEKFSTTAKEMDRLQKVEQQQISFKKEKEAFDKMIAAKDPAAYKSFYERIEPETAKELYKQAVGSVAQSTLEKKYLADITAMKDKAAAAALEDMVGTNLDLVVNILRKLDKDKTGSILSIMETTKAAEVLKRMTP